MEFCSFIQKNKNKNKNGDINTCVLLIMLYEDKKKCNYKKSMYTQTDK